jgi:hypothetical protein
MIALLMPANLVFCCCASKGGRREPFGLDLYVNGSACFSDCG